MSPSEPPDPDTTQMPADPANMAADPLKQSFRVTSISRSDLLQRPGLTEADVRQLDDGAMTRIAARLEDYFVETSFWETLERLARAELVAQQKQPHPTRDR